MKVRGNLIDLLAFTRLVPGRRKRIRRAPARPVEFDHIGDLAARLHPARLDLVIGEVRDEAAQTRVFKLFFSEEAVLQELPYFRAGQYLSIRDEVDGVVVTRPYSICSSPAEAADRGYYEIAVKKKDGGFFSEHVFQNWREGTRLTCTGPHGFFYIDALRDKAEIVALAGGSGITPFRSMLKDALQERRELRITLIYGIKKPGEAIFGRELQELAAKSEGRVQVFFVCSEPDANWSGPTGFLTAELISELAGGVEDKTIFMCGPQAMYRFLEEELAGFHLPPGRVRREVFGEASSVDQLAGYPRERAGKRYTVSVHMEGEVKEIPARSDETVLVAMERAGLAPPAACRSGECGWCRSLLLSGEIFVSPECDGRRAADKKYGYFHPCASYPLSDLSVMVPRDK